LDFLIDFFNLLCIVIPIICGAGCQSDPCVHSTKCTDGFLWMYECTCEIGWDGDDCDEDINECTKGTDTCKADEICVNSIGSYNCTKDTTPAVCPAGWTGYPACNVDINECDQGTDNCEETSHVCSNTAGSFVCVDCAVDVNNSGCVCEPGYERVNGVCQDKNECDKADAAGTDLCNAEGQGECVNTDGSFECTCSNGFMLVGNVCVDQNECDDGTDNCDSNVEGCVNAIGSFTCISCANSTDAACSCAAGQHRDEDGHCVANIACTDDVCTGPHMDGCTQIDANTVMCTCEEFWSGENCNIYEGEATIGPGHGSVGLTDVVNLDFVSDSFAEPTFVKVTVTTDTDDLFEESLKMFGPESRLDYQVCIEMDNPLVVDKIDVRFDSAASLLNGVDGLANIEAFALVKNGMACAVTPVDMYTLINGAAMDEPKQKTFFKLPSWAFNKDSADQKYKTCVSLATTLGDTPNAHSVPPGKCGGVSLTCPVQGGCNVLTAFKVPDGTPNVSGHFGVDYATATESLVFAAAKGTVLFSGEGMFGKTVILKHTDGSTTLYAPLYSSSVTAGAQLLAGQQLGVAGVAGSCSEPYMHFQYAPTGMLFKSKDLIDPDPCVEMLFGEGSISVQDSGLPAVPADDVFQVALNGLSIGLTKTGAATDLHTHLSASNLIKQDLSLAVYVISADEAPGTWKVRLYDGLEFTDGTTLKTGSGPVGTQLEYEIVFP